jgi:hypothetical protein
MQQLTELQIQFLNSLEESGITVPISENTMDRFFFADVVPCLNGEFSTGSTTNDAGVNVPLLSISLSAATEEHNEAKADWSWEHGENDLYEGEIMAVRWSASDTLEFFSVDDDGVIHKDSPVGSCSVQRAMGE